MKKLNTFQILSIVSLIGALTLLVIIPTALILGCNGSKEKTVVREESDYEIYERVREKLEINSEFVFESTLSKQSEDLIFKDSSTYVSFSSDRVPGFVTIYYTRTDWKDKDYFGEKDFGVILVPEDKILGEKEELLKWLKEYHIKKACEKSI